MRSRHSSLTDRTNRSAYALQFGAHGGVRATLTPAVASHCSTAPLHFGSRSHSNSRPSDNRTIFPAASRKTLNHEGLVRMWRASDHLHPPRPHLQQKRHVIRHQTATGPDLGGEKVGRHQRWPMRLQERAPHHRALTTRRDASRAQNSRDRSAADSMAKVLQGALNARVAPRRILRRHPDNQCSKVRLQARRAASPARHVHLRATSWRCQRKIVSGVTSVATSASTRRPSRCPSSARRRRSPSSKRRR